MSDMKPFRDLITFDEAKSIIMESTRPVEGTEEVTLLEAPGRVLAADIVAGRSVPGFRRASMDGYAVRAEDTFGATRAKPVELSLKGKVFAGQRPSGEVVAGTCIQAATGAPMPGGSDAVVMVEETSTEGDTIRVHKPVYPGAHVSEADADIGEGERVMSAGTTLTPPRTGVLAALGLENVRVYRRPRVMVYPTGDEVVRPGGELTFGKVYDINSYTMATLLESLGAEVSLGDIGEDSLEGLTRCLRDAAGMDYILFSGGSSVGERDLLSTLAEKGALPWHRAEARQAHPLREGGRCPGVRDDGISDVVPQQRLRASRPFTAQSRPPGVEPPHGQRHTGRPGGVHHRQAPDLHGAAGGRCGRAGFQGIRGHHVHEPGGWVCRDPCEYGVR
jgi:molybdopterin biosynthesis enzyme